MRTSQQFYKRIKEWAIFEKQNILKERTFNRNFPFAFLGLGNLGEELVLYLDENSLGSSSKGGCSYDNIVEIDSNFNTLKAREIKFISLNGTKQCKKCEQKAPPFQLKCLKCSDNNFKLISDSRSGISASAHVKYGHIIQEYVIFISDYNEKSDILNLKCFKILSDNIYFANYCKNQFENGTGNTCNLLPYSYDWYSSGPIKLLDLNIICKNLNNESIDEDSLNKDSINNNFLEILFDNFDNSISEKIPTELLKHLEIDNSSNSDFIDYSEIKDKLTLKHKLLGKKRGELTRK